jgi:hypothetical protein
MKHLFSFILILMVSLPLQAQEKNDTTYWKTSGNLSVNFSEASLTNWASGGESSLSGVGMLNFSATFEKDKVKWENTIHAGYGLLKEGKKEWTKSEDKIVLGSKFGLQTGVEQLFYAADMDFRTQFAPGYSLPNHTDRVSAFLSPAYLTLALGIDYKPSEKVSLFFSPVSGKATLVSDLNLSEHYGVKAGKKTRGEFGATIKGHVKTPLMKNVDIESLLTLFSNYLDKPQNIDVLWDLQVNMKINDFLSASFTSNLIYDDDTKTGIDTDDDGDIDKEGPRIQFKQILGVGLSYRF